LHAPQAPVRLWSGKGQLDDESMPMRSTTMGPYWWGSADVAESWPACRVNGRTTDHRREISVRVRSGKLGAGHGSGWWSSIRRRRRVRTFRRQWSGRTKFVWHDQSGTGRAGEAFEYLSNSPSRLTNRYQKERTRSAGFRAESRTTPGTRGELRDPPSN